MEAVGARAFPHDRMFYSGMALVAAAIVVIGFSSTFFLRSASLPPLPQLLIVHGIVFSSWFALFIVQTSLIAANRRDIHRKLGVVGACLAAAMVVLMVVASVQSLRLGHTPLKGLDPRSFFAIPARDIVTFSILVSAAIFLRRHPESHKRLMILATIDIVDAAIARFPIDAIAAYGPPAFFGIQDTLIVAALIYDFSTRGRVHPAYKWGAALIILSQALCLGISGTLPWLAFADWVLG